MTQHSTAQLVHGIVSPRAQCPTCKEVFSNVRNFDAHMLPSAKRTKGKVCVDPASVGLVVSDSTGAWITEQDWKNDFGGK